MDSTIEEMSNIFVSIFFLRHCQKTILYEALQLYFKKTRNGYKIDFEWELQEIPPLKKEFEVAVFRMFQEFLSNSVRHGQSFIVEVGDRIRKDDELKMKFVDNGIGFDLNQVNEFGMGIKNIITRTKLFKGFVNIASNPGNGTTYEFAFRLSAVLQ